MTIYYVLQSIFIESLQTQTGIHFVIFLSSLRNDWLYLQLSWKKSVFVPILDIFCFLSNFPPFLSPIILSLCWEYIYGLVHSSIWKRENVECNMMRNFDSSMNFSVLIPQLYILIKESRCKIRKYVAGLTQKNIYSERTARRVGS